MSTMTVRTGARLEVALEARRWTRSRLAAELGVSRQTLHKWLTGRAPWPRERLVQVSVLLGVSVSELLEAPELCPTCGSLT